MPEIDYPTDSLLEIALHLRYDKELPKSLAR